MDHLTDAELAYHQQLIADMKAAQAAWQSWSRHLGVRYRLGPTDSIGEAGEIFRGADETEVPA